MKVDCFVTVGSFFTRDIVRPGVVLATAREESNRPARIFLAPRVSSSAASFKRACSSAQAMMYEFS